MVFKIDLLKQMTKKNKIKFCDHFLLHFLKLHKICCSLVFGTVTVIDINSFNHRDQWRISLGKH